MTSNLTFRLTQTSPTTGPPGHDACYEASTRRLMAPPIGSGVGVGGAGVIVGVGVGNGVFVVDGVGVTFENDEMSASKNSGGTLHCRRMNT